VQQRRWPAAAPATRSDVMEINANEISQILRQRIEGLETTVDRSEQGTVVSVGDGIATVYGLDDVMYGEMVEFPNDVMGIALNLEEDSVGVVLMGDTTRVSEGSVVRRTGRIMSVPV